jgi:hypothetical protein
MCYLVAGAGEGAKRQPLVPHGERAGTRTRDPLIKSQMLYRLSYALGGSAGLLAFGRRRKRFCMAKHPSDSRRPGAALGGAV